MAKAAAAAAGGGKGSEAPATGAAAGAGGTIAGGETQQQKPGDGKGAADGKGAGESEGDGKPKPKEKPAEGGGDGKGGEGKGEKAGEQGKEGTDGKGDKTGKEGTEEEKPKAPEHYELQIPEGAEELVGAEDLAFIESIARANDWTNEEAQTELVSLLERTATSLQAREARWASQVKADKVYGGENFETTQANARRAVDAICPEDSQHRAAFLKLINTGGIGSNPTLVSVLADFAAKHLTEDNPTFGKVKGGGKQEKTAAEKIYDHPDNARIAKEAAGG